MKVTAIFSFFVLPLSAIIALFVFYGDGSIGDTTMTPWFLIYLIQQLITFTATLIMSLIQLIQSRKSGNIVQTEVSTAQVQASADAKSQGNEAGRDVTDVNNSKAEDKTQEEKSTETDSEHEDAPYHKIARQ